MSDGSFAYTDDELYPAVAGKPKYRLLDWHRRKNHKQFWMDADVLAKIRIQAKAAGLSQREFIRRLVDKKK